jgi:hypothetical protein
MTDNTREYLARRQQAYSRTFDTLEDAFGDHAAVIADLMKFCRFGESVFHNNQRMTDVLIGRQEVLHRILDHAGLDLEALYVKYNNQKFDPRRQKQGD